MRIEEFHIDGFGRFCELSWKQVPSGLSVVVGDNEAGKSTLLAFLRSVMFGLPTRGQKAFYPPLNGGRKGGRLILSDRHAERIIVERREGKGAGTLTVTFPDGRTGGEEAFRPLIGSATAELYENVFAFSLSELQEFNSLDKGQIRDAIYSAGVGVGRKTLTEISKGLKNRYEGLFTAGGSKRKMNQLLTQIETIQKNVKDHHHDQDKYEQVRSDLKAADAQVETLRTELHTARSKRDRVKILQQAWDNWVSLESHRSELESVPEVESFPIDGVKRLNELSFELREFRDQLSDETSERDRLSAELDGLRFDDAVFDSAEAIRRLERGRELFETSLQKLPGQETAVRLAGEKLSGLLRELGDDWDESRVEKFTISSQLKDQIESCRQELKSATVEVRDQQTRLRLAQQELTDAEEERDTAGQTLQQLPESSDEKLVASAKPIVSGREGFAGQSTELSRLENQLESGIAGLKDTLRNIGAGWNESRLRSADTSLAVHDEVESFRNRFVDLRAERRQDDPVPALPIPAWTISLISAIGLAAFLGIGWGRGDWISGSIILAFSVGVAVLLMLVRRSVARAASAQNAQRIREAADSETRLAVLQQNWSDWLKQAEFPDSLAPETAAGVLARLDTAREQLKSIDRDRGQQSTIQQTMQKFEQQCREAGQAWKLEAVPDDDLLRIVEGLEVRLDQRDREVRSRGEAERRAEDAAAQLAKKKKGFANVNASHSESVDAEKRLTEDWIRLLNRAGIEEALSVENAQRVFQSVERTRDQLSVVQEGRAQTKSLEELIAEYRADVRTVSASAGQAEPSHEEVSGTVSNLLALLKAEEESRRGAEGLRGKKNDADSRHSRIQRHINNRQEEIGALLETTATSDEEAFRKKAADFEARQTLRHQIQQAQVQLRKLVGGGAAFEELKLALQTSSIDDLNREQNDLTEQIENLEQSCTDAVDERGRLKEQLEQLKHDEELSALRIKEQSSRSDFETAASEWAVLKLAAHLINRARVKYEKERRPAVLKEAESYFSRFTEGGYSEIRPSDDGHGVVVLTPAGQIKEAGQLSRGTAEQLYLSLRFGFVSEFVRHSDPLPLVFDDILVNFDPRRARAAAEAILELAESQQILFFTCQPSTADLFRQIDSEVSTIEVKDGRFV
jgi:uncharacterized protein YhaN